MAQKGGPIKGMQKEIVGGYKSKARGSPGAASASYNAEATGKPSQMGPMQRGTKTSGTKLGSSTGGGVGGRKLGSPKAAGVGRRT